MALFLEIVISLSLSQTASADQFKLLTFNFNAETTNKALKNNRLAIFEDYIQKNNVDAVLIQECWDLDDYVSMSIKVAKDLNMDFAYHLEDGLAHVRVTSTCILSKKNLDLRNIRMFKLPHSAFTIGDGQNTWAGFGEVNILIGGTLTLPNGTPIHLWTSHFTGASYVNNYDQLFFSYQQMLADVQENGEKWENAQVILAGDFNSTLDWPGLTYLTGLGGLKDEWSQGHPGDPGYTAVGTLLSPEYDPMIHGTGFFPPQYYPIADQAIDHMLTHRPSQYSAAIMRVFTSPINNTWMSDHYGLLTTFDLNGIPPVSNPSADTDMAALGSPTIFTLTESGLANLPRQKNFVVTSKRGLTLIDEPNVDTQFFFTNDKGNAYPSNSADITTGNTASFAFFKSGNYKYRMIVRDYRRNPQSPPDYTKDPRVSEMDGTVSVNE